MKLRFIINGVLIHGYKIIISNKNEIIYSDYVEGNNCYFCGNDGEYVVYLYYNMKCYKTSIIYKATKEYIICFNKGFITLRLIDGYYNLPIEKGVIKLWQNHIMC